MIVDVYSFAFYFIFFEITACLIDWYRCRRLTHLRAGSLAGLARLRSLSARDSGLVHLHHAVFSHLSHLEELYLRNNHLGDQVRRAFTVADLAGESLVLDDSPWRLL